MRAAVAFALLATVVSAQSAVFSQCSACPSDDITLGCVAAANAGTGVEAACASLCQATIINDCLPCIQTNYASVVSQYESQLASIVTFCEAANGGAGTSASAEASTTETTSAAAETTSAAAEGTSAAADPTSAAAEPTSAAASATSAAAAASGSSKAAVSGASATSAKSSAAASKTSAAAATTSTGSSAGMVQPAGVLAAVAAVAAALL